MDGDWASEEIRIELEDTVEHQEISAMDQHGICSKNIIEEEHSGNQTAEDSTHKTMKGLMEDRDPKGVNKCLKVSFEDVIAEPASVRSLDKVWLWSHALFEVSRLWFYRLISLLLAVPVALVLGLLFAFLSCLHIWLIMPSMQLLLINMNWVKVVWASVLDLAISPFFSSVGRCCGAINIRWGKE
ncbi:caveolin-2-like [Colossoma macropomum]|uniref:caveolin-2-like n=1 Tax=Colossoma macropomum TaxID=42526 RepID=UPI00186407EA|nr:caveolin-2-like [Colossoma macropomum]